MSSCTAGPCTLLLHAFSVLPVSVLRGLNTLALGMQGPYILCGPPSEICMTLQGTFPALVLLMLIALNSRPECPHGGLQHGRAPQCLAPLVVQLPHCWLGVDVHRMCASDVVCVQRSLGVSTLRPERARALQGWQAQERCSCCVDHVLVDEQQLGGGRGCLLSAFCVSEAARPGPSSFSITPCWLTVLTPQGEPCFAGCGRFLDVARLCASRIHELSTHRPVHHQVRSKLRCGRPGNDQNLC